MSHRADPSTLRPAALTGEAAIRAILHQHPDLDLETITRIAIEVEMARPDSSLTNSARRLGIGRTTLYRKLQRYGLPTPRDRKLLERGAPSPRSSDRPPRKTSP